MDGAEDDEMELVITSSKRKEIDKEDDAVGQQQKAARSLPTSTQLTCKTQQVPNSSSLTCKTSAQVPSNPSLTCQASAPAPSNPSLTCQASAPAPSNPSLTCQASAQVSSSPPTIIYVKSTEGRSLNSNPGKLNQALNSSPLGKYILEGRVRALGTGTALRIEVARHSLSKLPTPLGEITNLGPWQVKCWESKNLDPNLFYGKVGPFDRTYTTEHLWEDFNYLDHSAGATLTEVEPSPPRADGSRFFRLAFEGARLPKNILLGNQVIYVTEYKMPALRCRNCYLFGHGALACRRKVRCANCSGYHPFVSADGDRCSREPYCYFCQEGHRLNSRSCPALLKANEIKEKCRERKLGTLETHNELRTVTPQKALTNTTRNNHTSHQTPYRPPATNTAPQIILNNSYAILSDLSEDDFAPASHEAASTILTQAAYSSGPYTPVRSRRTRRRSTGNTPARQHTLTSSIHQTMDIQVHHPVNTPPQQEMPSVRPKHPQAQTYATTVTGERPTQQRNTPYPPGATAETQEMDWLSILTRAFNILCRGFILYQKGTSFFEIICHLSPALLAIFTV